MNNSDVFFDKTFMGTNSINITSRELSPWAQKQKQNPSHRMLEKQKVKIFPYRLSKLPQKRNLELKNHKKINQFRRKYDTLKIKRNLKDRVAFNDTQNEDVYDIETKWLKEHLISLDTDTILPKRYEYFPYERLQQKSQIKRGYFQSSSKGKQKATLALFQKIMPIHRANAQTICRLRNKSMFCKSKPDLSTLSFDQNPQNLSQSVKSTLDLKEMKISGKRTRKFKVRR